MFIYNYKVKWADTDAAGIVYYPNFYKWMDQATAETFYSLDLPLSKLFAEEKFGIPLVEAHCEFKTPAFFEDLIRIETNIVELREKVIKLTHDIYRNDTLLARGYEVRVWVLVKSDKINSAIIPEKVREVMTKYIKNSVFCDITTRVRKN